MRLLAISLSEQARREYLDERGIRGELLELQQRRDVGDIGEEEYDRLADDLLARLDASRSSGA